jgi:Ser/Thr protein kinase RdoA (MazF antagonist)
MDEQGREVLTYLDGETIGETRPWPVWARSDGALVAAGRWLRDFHSASASFVPPPGARWHERDQLWAGEIIGHHDAAPYNAVWRRTPKHRGETDSGEGELVGFIDWDLAGPCLPMRDLAFVALTWVPLTARDIAIAAVRERAIDHASGLRSAAPTGYEPATRLVAEGVAMPSTARLPNSTPRATGHPRNETSSHAAST